MLDTKSAQLLKRIRNECEDGSFKIFTSEELGEDFSGEDSPCPEVIAEIINYLEEREFIRVKYRDENSYCLTVLSKGRLYEESESERKREQNSFKKFVIISFASGFLGALFGVLFTSLCLHLF